MAYWKNERVQDSRSQKTTEGTGQKESNKRVMRKWAELLVKIKNALRFMHKLSNTNDESIGICWWNSEEVYKGMWSKKAEQSTPTNIKVEEPPTPNLLYPSNPSHSTSPDPNMFENCGHIATA